MKVVLNVPLSLAQPLLHLMKDAPLHIVESMKAGIFADDEKLFPNKWTQLRIQSIRERLQGKEFLGEILLEYGVFGIQYIFLILSFSNFKTFSEHPSPHKRQVPPQQPPQKRQDPSMQTPKAMEKRQEPTPHPMVKRETSR